MSDVRTLSSPYIAAALSWDPISATEVFSSMLIAVIVALAFYMIEVNSTFMMRRSSRDLDLVREPSSMHDGANGEAHLGESGSSSMLAPVMDAVHRSVRVRARAPV